MVEVAEQAGVGEVSRPVFGPVVEVVGFAPGRRAVAAGPDAAAVANGEGKPLVAVEEALGHTVIEDSGL